MSDMFNLEFYKSLESIPEEYYIRGRSGEKQIIKLTGWERYVVSSIGWVCPVCGSGNAPCVDKCCEKE